MATRTPEFTQGRIRVNQEGADEVSIALDKHMEDLLEARNGLKDVDEARVRLNRRVMATRRVMDELDRVYEERGWDSGDEAEVSGSTT